MLSNKINNLVKKYRKYKKIQSIDNKKKINNFKIKVRHAILMHWTWPKKVFLGMFKIVLLGAILLYLPISYDLDYSNNNGYKYVNNEYIFYFMDTPTDLYNTKELNFNFIDSLFLAVSAFTTTGISGKLDIGSHMSYFGQFVMFVLLQIGGFGYASLLYLFGRFLQKVFHRQFFSSALSNIERGGTKITDSPKMLLRIFLLIVSIQICFSLIISIIFVVTPFKVQQNVYMYLNNQLIPINGVTSDSDVIYSGYKNYGIALWHALFLCGSAINNAGFDLFGTSSLAIFRNDIGIIIQFFVISLFFIGGIGYQIIFDLMLRIEYIWKYRFLYKVCGMNKYASIAKNKISSFSKICLTTTFIIIIISTSLVYLTEHFDQYSYVEMLDVKSLTLPLHKIPKIAYGYDINNNIVQVKPFGNNYSLNVNFTLFFNSMSTRSAGFSTISMSSLGENTKWLFIILMFIGTSPSSTGGGIRITTLAVMFKSMINWLRGLTKSSLYKRNIPNNDVIGSFLISTLCFVMLVLFSFVTYSFTLIPHIDYNGENINLIQYLKQKNSVTLTFSDFMFDMASSFGTCGLSSGVLNADKLGWWSKIPSIILMFIGQMGIGATLLLFARKVPKRNNPNYIEQPIRLG